MTLSRLALVLAVLVAAPAAAQPAPPADRPALSDAPCTYDACALRVEPDLLGSRLVRGEGGVAVGRINGFGPDLTEAVAGSPVALEYARTYERSRTPAMLGALGAGVLLGIALTDTREGVQIGAALGSAGLSALTIPLAVRSRRAFSRALWEYNRGLPRER